MDTLLHDFPNHWLLLAEGVPNITSTYLMQLISRVLHILSAIILVGGLFYLRTILSPGGTDGCFGSRREVWARWVGIASFLLLASGIYNFMNIFNVAKASGEKLPPTYHMLLGIKFLLALFVLFIAAILAGKTAAADRFRLNMRKWLNIGWLAAMAIVVIAAMLRTFH